MTEGRLRGAIGLAMKAGRCESGDFAVERALRRGRILLVVLDEGVSEATRERYAQLCAARRLPLLFVKDSGEAIGKPSRRILGVTDENFKNMILGAYEASNGIKPGV